MVYSGTVIPYTQATGEQTEIGRISAMLSMVEAIDGLCPSEGREDSV